MTLHWQDREFQGFCPRKSQEHVSRHVVGCVVTHLLSCYPARVEAGESRVLGEWEGSQQETAKLWQEKVYREMTSEVSEGCNTADRNRGVELLLEYARAMWADFTYVQICSIRKCVVWSFNHANGPVKTTRPRHSYFKTHPWEWTEDYNLESAGASISSC